MTQDRDAHVAVIGAGPAGIAAALTAARAGARVTVVDEQARPGGQIWRQPAGALGGPTYSGPGRHALDDLAGSGVEVRCATLVWGAGDRQVLLLGNGERIQPRATVVATGAFDRPVPIPGWTLPGTVTAGGAQALIKGQRVLPGRSAIVAGAGPFLLVTAMGLLQAGARVVAVVEATKSRRLARHALRGAQHPARIRDLAAYRFALARAHVPVLGGHGLVRITGDESVSGAVIARLDADWRPVADTERHLKADCVCLGYGFVPAIEVAATLGCDLRWDARAGERVVTVDGDLQTSVPGVFAAGEVTGVGGAELAWAEGEIAGAGAARHAGFDTRPPRGSHRKRRRALHLARLMADLFAPRRGIWELADDATLACRCECVSHGEIRAAIRNSASSLAALKSVTRVGMGACQGRLCAGSVAQLVGHPEQGFTFRPPTRPIGLDVVTTADR